MNSILALAFILTFTGIVGAFVASLMHFFI